MTESPAKKRMAELQGATVTRYLASYRNQLVASAQERAPDSVEKIRASTDQEILEMIMRLGSGEDTEAGLLTVHLQTGLANAGIDALRQFVIERAEQQDAFNQKVQEFMDELSMLDIWPGKRA